MASVDSVPAVKYGKAALTYLGVWEAVAPRVAQAENVRAALAFVARGEAPLGIVYGTDAKAEPAVGVVGTFPEESHPKIEYPVALLINVKPQGRTCTKLRLASRLMVSRSWRQTDRRGRGLRHQGFRK
jgi:molybdate transport system substrate-binding protein